MHIKVPSEEVLSRLQRSKKTLLHYHRLKGPRRAGIDEIAQRFYSSLSCTAPRTR